MDEDTVMPEEQASTEQPQPEEAAGAPPVEMRAEDALMFAVGLFVDLAWIHLGIRADPGSGETKTDLPQARLAIDALAALVPLAEGRFDPRRVRDLHNLLSSLQLNYVQRYSAGG